MALSKRQGAIVVTPPKDRLPAMNDPTPPETFPPTLRFLRGLVLVLTATMIVGLLVVIFLLATRLPGASTGLTLPPGIALPDGTTPLAYTVGPGWVAVVTAGSDILIYDPATGTLRQTLHIDP